MEDDDKPVTLDEIMKIINDDVWYKSYVERRTIMHKLLLRIMRNGYSYTILTEVIVKGNKET